MRAGLALLALALAALAPLAPAATPKVGARAPALTLRTLEGQQLDLAQLGRVEVVNVWATWCAPCRAEMPMLDAFYRAHAAAGLVMAGASADRSRDKADVGKAMAGLSYPAGLLSEARVDGLDAPRVLPMTYVVDKTGVVRAVFGGGGPALTAEALATAVEPLL